MKIDGDRFVVVQRQQTYYLVGFEELELLEKPSFSVLEWYAGEFYVVYPFNHGAIPSFRCKRKGEERIISIRAHPWLKRDQISMLDQYRPKYEGVMIYAKGKEYRAKWSETAEVMMDGLVWEVTLDQGELRLLRPRPGKVPSSVKAARATMGWAIPGRELLRTLVTKGVS